MGRAKTTLPLEEKKYRTDQYRQAAFRLLRAARVLAEASADIERSGAAVSVHAVTDLNEARAIVAALPAVKVSAVVSKT